MPARSEAQRRLFGIAKAIKEGKTPASYSPVAARIAKTVSLDVIRDYAKGIRGRRLNTVDHKAIKNLLKK
jgi:hypothetical protein